jgi:hypothetical protein
MFSFHSLLQVIDQDIFLVDPVIVDYCQYGSNSRKRTSLWSTFRLSRVVGGLEIGMRVLTCPGASCLAMVDGRHAQWEKRSLAERQSIPVQLSRQLAVALRDHLLSTWVLDPVSQRGRRHLL